MIKVTIWNEFVQEQLCEDTLKKFGFERMPENEKKRNFARTEEIRRVHPQGIHQTLKDLIEEEEEFKVCHIATLEMEECGLTEEVLDDTDVPGQEGMEEFSIFSRGMRQTGLILIHLFVRLFVMG